MPTKPIIFLAFANERQKDTQYLRNLSRELESIREALEPAEEAGLCEVKYEPNASLRKIVDAFQKFGDRIAIFHYAGHANSYRLLLEESSSDTNKTIHTEGLNEILAARSVTCLVYTDYILTMMQMLKQ